MATMTHVSHQWRTRPAHERFYDVRDVVPILEREQRLQRSILAPMDQLKISAVDDDFVLGVPGVPNPVHLNNWSFQRLCDQTGMDASFVRKMPAELMAPAFQYQLMHNAGIAKKNSKDTTDDDVDEEALALFGELARPVEDSQSAQLNILMAPNRDGGLYARDIAGASYGRYSNLQLANDAMLAVSRGWKTPRAMSTGNNPYTGDHIQADRVATTADEMRCSLIKAGMRIGPAGVYVGDRNIFIFLANDTEVLPGHYRFITLENSEVGENRKLRATFGLMNYVCMNHILWGVTNVSKVEKKHRRGSVAEFSGDFEESLELVSSNNNVPKSLYDLARSKILGTTEDAVSDEVFGFAKKNQLLAITRRSLKCALQCMKEHPEDRDGADMYSVWSVVQGLTRYSQAIPYADKRHALDVAAGKLLDALNPDESSVTVAGSSISGNVIDGGIVITDAPKPKGRKTSKAS